MSRSAVSALSLWWNGKRRDGAVKRRESMAADSEPLEQRWLFAELHKQGGGVVDVRRRAERPGVKSQNSSTHSG